MPCLVDSSEFFTEPEKKMEKKKMVVWWVFWSYHNACSGDDTHQEIWHQSSDDHHDALHHSDGGKESENEVEEVIKARPELHHVVGNRPRRGTEQHQEREGGEEVGKSVCCHTIVPIEPLCIEHLLPSHQQQQKYLLTTS